MWVLLGGIVGASTRWILLTAADGYERLSMLAVNVVGTFVFGVMLAQRNSMSTNSFLMVTVGFAGGLTTFSAYALDVANELREGHFLAASYLSIGVPLVMIIIAGLGYRIGSKVGPKLKGTGPA